MIEVIHSYLVHPAKNQETAPPISKAAVPNSGKLFDMLIRVFERANTECDIEIAFAPDDGGRQKNPCRDDLVAYVDRPTLNQGLALAKRLQKVTTHRSGLGLFFVMKGVIGKKPAAVLSRFPADQGILAEEHGQELSVEFIERIFMKNAKAYKSAYYSSQSTKGGFWKGRAVDRQISGPREISDYWIRDFLISELTTTSAAGTKRVAVAVRQAARNAGSLEVKRELVAAATLLRGQDGKTASANQFLDWIGLSETAKDAVRAGFNRDDLMDEIFLFDREEFSRHAQYRAVELDTGAMLLAEDSEFDSVFRGQVMNAAEGRVKYEAEGVVVNEALKKVK